MRDGQRVIVETSNDAETDYDYVIGADGTRSTVRQSLGIDFPGHDLPEKWSIADVDAVNWTSSKVLTFCMMSGGRVVVVAPLETERFRVISNTDNALETLPLNLEVTNIRRLLSIAAAMFAIP